MRGRSLRGQRDDGEASTKGGCFHGASVCRAWVDLSVPWTFGRSLPSSIRLACQSCFYQARSRKQEAAKSNFAWPIDGYRRLHPHWVDTQQHDPSTGCLLLGCGGLSWPGSVLPWCHRHHRAPPTCTLASRCNTPVASIERTAYLRFKHRPSAQELTDVDTPTAEELAFIRAHSRGLSQTITVEGLLKSVQRRPRNAEPYLQGVIESWADLMDVPDEVRTRLGRRPR